MSLSKLQERRYAQTKRELDFYQKRVNNSSIPKVLLFAAALILFMTMVNIVVDKWVDGIGWLEAWSKVEWNKLPIHFVFYGFLFYVTDYQFVRSSLKSKEQELARLKKSYGLEE